MQQMINRQIYVGFDPKEAAAYWVATESIKRRLRYEIPVIGMELGWLVINNYYKRPQRKTGNEMWDVISDHPMSTEFAISRFLVPQLAKTGWALFMDCDTLTLCDLNELFSLADPRYAVMCVKHEHSPISSTKMLGKTQSAYPRKNWSSVCLFNCDHPANKALTIEVVNTWTGRDLHAFKWLKDEEIGALPSEYNFLVGHSQGPASIVHFTEGGPWLPEYESVQFASDWRIEVRHIVRDSMRKGVMP